MSHGSPLTSSEKLQALTTLTVRSGLAWQEHHDISLWTLLAGSNFDMTPLSDKTLEHIETLYSRHFEV